MPGELLVKFRLQASASAETRVLANHGFRKLRKLEATGLAHVKLPENKTVDAALADLRQDPDVEWAQPNFIYRVKAIPDDPHYGQLWGLKNTGQTISSPGGPDNARSTHNPGTTGYDMALESAWSHITDCSAATVAVVDTGVNYNHADLAANMWDGGSSYPHHGYNYIDNNDDPMDQAGHGTHVAGTIGAVGNNGLGTAGVCWKARLMAVRVLDATGAGTTVTVTQGINFAASHGAKVINLSIGGSAYDSAYSSAITNARNAGAVVVAAAGNESADNDDSATPSYPCNFTQSNLLCVAALDQSYALASFSNYGAASVDIGAPGVNIVSEWPGTHTTVTDALTGGWSTSSTTASGWGYRSLNFSTPSQCLVNPPAYDHSSANYSNSTDDRIWKSFDTSGSVTTTLDFWAMYDLAAGDYLDVRAQSAAGDPMVSGTLLDTFTGSTSGARESYTYDLTSFIGPNTTVGFNLTSNAATASWGANISLFSITKLTYNNTTYNVLSGTSMAAPHVSGLAAMLFAFNPNYTYAEVIAAIKNGGVSVAALSGKTATGKAAHAQGALAYIAPPTGVTVVKQ